MAAGLRCVSHTMQRVGRLRLIMTLLLMSGVTGCTSHPPGFSDADIHTVPASRLPSSALIDTVPFIAQDEHACGPASLAMVLRYYGNSDKHGNLHKHGNLQKDGRLQKDGHRQTQQDLKPLLLLPERQGTLQIELMSAARQEGFLALAGPTRLESLLDDVAAGFPVIVLQNLRFTFWPQWHYAVVVGYDQREGVVLLRSGQHRLIEVPFNTFINTWQRADMWALRITPPTQLPPSTTANEIVDAAESLAQVRQSSSALAAYFTASQRWPDDTRLWNGLANLAYAQQRWTLAQQAFAQSLLIDARQARLWNNFAYALQQTACDAYATAALSCAQKLAPNDPYLQDSRTELNGILPIQKYACDAVITPQCKIDPDKASLPDVRLQ